MNMKIDEQSRQPIEIIDYTELLGIIKSQFIWVAVSALLFAGLGLFYSWIATPVYKADALVQIESSKSPLLGIGDMTSLISEDGNAASEIELIRSRMVLGEVVESLKLNTIAEPKYFPVLGRAFSRHFSPSEETPFAQPLLFDSLAWGGEKIKVERLVVPQKVLGKKLELIKKENTQFSVSFNEQILLEGKVGQLVRSSNGDFEIFVSQLEARSGTRFILMQKDKNQTIGSLVSRLSISEKGKNTGLLRLVLSGSDPRQNRQALDVIAKVYLKQNVSRKSEEAQNSLAFLAQQLPVVQAEVSMAESQLNNFRLKNHSVDLTLETQALLEQIVELETQLSEIELERSQLLMSFTESHPVFLGLDDEKRLINDKLEVLNQGSQSLPDTQIQIMRLTRKVEVSTEVYTQLLNRLHELKIAKAGAVGSVRIVDFAYNPPEPVKPQKSLILVMSIVLGGMLGAALVLVRYFMNPGIKTPEEIESALGLSVYAAVPLSERLGILIKNAKKQGGRFLLAESAPKDLAIESLRSLRTNLAFAIMDSPNNCIMITGSAPGIGKSFVAANLAALMAENNQKVLLIDGDMRKGLLQEIFDIDRGKGLAECLCSDGKNIRLSSINENLTVLTSGQYPPNPAELLSSPMFALIIERFSKEYDKVIIDTPPILAVTDAALVGKQCGVNFMVVRANKTSIKELRYANERIAKAGIDIKGCVFNGMPPKTGAYGIYGGYYSYAYKDKE